jgi:hypothetical protein
MAVKPRKKVNRWSHRVTRESNALDLEQGVFTGNSPKEIARSLRRSAEQSRRRKTDHVDAGLLHGPLCPSKNLKSMGFSLTCSSR